MIKEGRLLAFASFIIPFGIYLTTLANTVSFFDSGELIAGVSTLGISHPPGYPLYIQMAHIFSYLPFGSLAFRANLFSAFMGALTIVILYFIEVRLLRSIFDDDSYKIEMTAFSSVLLFALSLNHWGQTNMSEVYALNTFFIALLLLILIIWREKIVFQGSVSDNTHASWLYLFSFLFGLGLGGHHTLLLIAPVFIFVLIITKKQLLFNVTKVSFFLFFFFLGFSIYLYLPVRASTDIMMNWGDPETFKQFKWMFLREGYLKVDPLRDWPLFIEQLKSINLIYEFTLFGFILGIIGIARFFLKAWFYSIVSLLVFMVLSVGVVIYGNPSKENIFLLEAFHTPTYMVFSLWIGVALFWLISLLSTFIEKLEGSEKARQGIMVLWMVVLVSLPSIVFSSHFKKSNRSRNFIAFDYAVNELKSLSQNAILFTWGDSGAFPLWYLHFIEDYRPDVLLLHTPHLASDWYINDIQDLKNSRIRQIPPRRRAPGSVVTTIVNENLGFRKSYLDYSSKYSYSTEKMEFKPHGLVYRHSVDKNDLVDNAIWEKYVIRDIFSNNIVKDLDTSKAISIYAYSHYYAGEALLKEGKREEAINEFKKSVQIIPGLKRQIQKNFFSREPRKEK